MQLANSYCFAHAIVDFQQTGLHQDAMGEYHQRQLFILSRICHLLLHYQVSATAQVPFDDNRVHV